MFEKAGNWLGLIMSSVGSWMISMQQAEDALRLLTIAVGFIGSCLFAVKIYYETKKARREYKQGK